MTDAEIRVYLRQLIVRTGMDMAAPEGFRAYASYAEFPGCVALGEDRTDAMRELETIIVPFIQQMLAAGAELPCGRT